MQASEIIEINASASVVWETLTDFTTYPAWNPFIRKATGTLAIGCRLKLDVSIPGGRNMKLHPKIIGLIPEQELRWVGGLFIPGLFEGDHRFLIQPIHSKRIRFIQTETFSGLLSPIISGWVSRDARKGFVAMNTALKNKLEGDI